MLRHLNETFLFLLLLRSPTHSHSFFLIIFPPSFPPLLFSLHTLALSVVFPSIRLPINLHLFHLPLSLDPSLLNHGNFSISHPMLNLSPSFTVLPSSFQIDLFFFSFLIFPSISVPFFPFFPSLVHVLLSCILFRPSSQSFPVFPLWEFPSLPPDVTYFFPALLFLVVFLEWVSPSLPSIILFSFFPSQWFTCREKLP